MQKYLDTLLRGQNAKLTSCQAQYNMAELTWYLYLIYTYETDEGEFELHIPKFDLGRVLPILRLPVIDIMYTHDGQVLLQPCSTISLEHMDTGDYDTYTNTCFAVRQVSKKKPVEMTLEEIEKKLGYKVKVVSKKQEVK